jgi:hypothetical protein
VSPQDLAGPGPDEPVEQKQRANIYTMMLLLSFIALCVACTLLWLELQAYGAFPWWKPPANLTPPAAWSLPGIPAWWA